MSDEVTLEDRLGCFGYYGFGGGYAMVKWGVADDTRGAIYCGQGCRRSSKCWDRHRDRVRMMFPDLTQLADEIAETHRGAAYMTEWLKQSGQSPESLVEPFSSVVMGNMEDGAAVASGGRPKDRGEWSLAWPLSRLPTT